MAGMDDYLRGSSYTDDSSEGGGQHMSLDDEGEGFYGRVTGNQDKKYGDHDATKAAKQKNAAEGLMGSEKNALGGNGSKITGDGTAGARQGEDNVASGTASDNATAGFKNNVTGESKSKGMSLPGKKGKSKGMMGKMKKMLPILIAAGGIGGFGLASFFGQLAMPFSLVSQLQSNFDSIGTSNYVRARALVRFALHPKVRKYDAGAQPFIQKHSKIYQIFTGNEEKYFKISDKQAARFKKKGIEVMDGGPNGQYLQIKNPDGGVTRVVADEGSADGKNYKYLEKVYEEDENFRSAYFESTKTWRQSIKAWFDNLCTKYLNRFSIKRNRFKGFEAKNDTDSTNAQFEKSFEQGIGVTEYDGNAETGGAGTPNKPVYNEEHEQIGTEPDYSPEGASRDVWDASGSTDAQIKLRIQKSETYDQIATKLTNFGNKIAAKYIRLKRAAQVASKGYCYAMEIVNAITLLAMANEAKEVMKTASTLMEGTQTAQIRDSSQSPINNLSNSLTRKKTTKYYIDSTGQTEEVYGSAMEAEAPTATYGNTWIDTRDTSVKSFKFSEPTKMTLLGLDISFLSDFSTTMTAYKTCIGSKMVLSLLDVFGDIAEVLKWAGSILHCIAGAIALELMGCAELIGKVVWTAVQIIAVKKLMEKVMKLVQEKLIPAVATMLQRKFYEDIGGHDFGNAVIGGGHRYMDKNHQQGGGMATDKAHYILYLKNHEEYIADIARHERETRSPFDASSPYTFMGNLLSRSIPILVGNNTIFEGIKNVASVTSKAITSIMPGASAVTAATTAQDAVDNTEVNCPELSSVDAVADVFCNPYFISDFSLMNDDPANITYKVSTLGNNFTEDEGDIPTINTKMTDDPKTTSRLMEYIVFCTQRDSPLGMVDMNYGNYISSIASGEQGSWTDYLPIWGGIADFLRNKAILEKMGYVTGASCVMKDNNDSGKLEAELGTKSFNWEEAKYYQRFIEDQRYLESAGLVDKNAVSIALDNYYAEHPLDQSEEGIMARMTGLTKDQVIAAENALDVMLWMAGYKPDGYYPYNYKEPEQDQISLSDYDYVDLEQYNTNDDYSWKYIIRMEYNIS